jgi:hypothetical protein
MSNIKNIVRVISFSFLASLVGCGQSTIDATTDKSFSSTLIQVRSSVNESNLELFDETIKLALKDIKYIKETEKGGYKWALKRSQSLGSIHDLTSVQIVSLGNAREREGKEVTKLKLSKRRAEIENSILDARSSLESELAKVNKIKIVNVVLTYVSPLPSNCNVDDSLCDRITVAFDIINKSTDILFDLTVSGDIPIQGHNLRIYAKDLLLEGLDPEENNRITFEQLIDVKWQRYIDIQEALKSMESKLELNISNVSFIKPFHKDKLQQYTSEYDQSYDEAISEYDQSYDEAIKERSKLFNRGRELFHKSYLATLIENRADRIHKALVYQSANPKDLEYYVSLQLNELNQLNEKYKLN